MNKNTKTEFEDSVDYIIETLYNSCDYETAYEYVQALKNIEDEMKMGYARKEIKKLINNVIEFCIESKICPECGGMLDWELTGNQNYVPYGMRTVLESEETVLGCMDCGYKID